MTSTADRWQVASRADVPPFHVMDLLAAAATRRRSHGDLLDLLAGQPSTGAPAPVRAEAIRLLESGDPLGYTPAVGILELREAIAGHHRRAHGIDVDPDEVIVTTGSSGGFLLAFLAAFEVGDKVAMARPCYRNVLTALGVEVVEVPTGPETRFQPTVEQLAALHEQHGLTGLVVASPANPTGTMLLPGELAALARWCEAERVQLISDEIYHGIEYAALDGGTRSARSAWETSREAVVFASFSKYFSMTGWRIGWMLVPDRLRRACDVLTGNFTICPPVLAQRACLAAFDEASYAELDGHVRRYADNRRILLEGLPRLGITELAPADGAFYAYADVGHLTQDTMAF
jgi:aspartate/methionine/tyrosine aminotransferase